MLIFVKTLAKVGKFLYLCHMKQYICVYADEIDNAGHINYDQLYAQLYAELQEGHRYWFDDEENQRIIGQNANFQQIDDYRRMIEIVYQSPDDTDNEAPFVSLQTVMKRLVQSFPTFVIGKNTDKEVGRQIRQMGYERKHQMQGTFYRMKEK